MDNNDFDIFKPSPERLILSYLEQVLESSLFLSYRDYSVIDNWLKLSKNNPDPILLILSDLCSEGYFDKKERSFQKTSLKRLDLIIKKRLKATNNF